MHTWLSDGTLRCDKDAGLYIYEEEFKTDVDHGEVRSLKEMCIRDSPGADRKADPHPDPGAAAVL